MRSILSYLDNSSKSLNNRGKGIYGGDSHHKYPLPIFMEDDLLWCYSIGEIINPQ